MAGISKNSRVGSKVQEILGSCADCGTTEKKLTPVRRHGVTGRGKMVKLCKTCLWGDEAPKEGK